LDYSVHFLIIPFQMKAMHLSPMHDAIIQIFLLQKLFYPSPKCFQVQKNPLP
jgi:hypothetical protein